MGNLQTGWILIAVRNLDRRTGTNRLLRYTSRYVDPKKIKQKYLCETSKTNQ